MENTGYTLRDLLRAISVLETSVDVSVDGTDFSIAVEGCDGIRLTPKAEKHFERALALPIGDGCYVTTNNDSDFDEYDESGTGAIAEAEDLLEALAGYCSTTDFAEWFEGADARLI